jgi:hypothetical protein
MKILITLLFILTASVITSAQVECPAGMVCISQVAANQAALNARELEATREKVKVLESALVDKDKSIAEVQETARKNEADLKDALHKTEVELSLKTGQLIGAENMNVRQTAIIEALVKVVRAKKIGLIVF